MGELIAECGMRPPAHRGLRPRFQPVGLPGRRGGNADLKIQNRTIEVAMGEGVVARPPHIISSKGLGSCVAVVLYDGRSKIGGLAHIMLPNSTNKGVQVTGGEGLQNEKYEIVNSQSSIINHQYRCSDTAILTLLEGLQFKGAARQNIVAKMAGGARMFSNYEDFNPGIGAENIMSIKEILKRERIPLVTEDIGGHHGRNVEFHLNSGKVIVRAIGKEEREI